MRLSRRTIVRHRNLQLFLKKTVAKFFGSLAQKRKSIEPINGSIKKSCHAVNTVQHEMLAVFLNVNYTLDVTCPIQFR